MILCIHLSFYNLGGSSLSCGLTSLTDLKRVVEFSVCSAFYLLGQRDGFQLPHMPEWKLKISESTHN